MNYSTSLVGANEKKVSKYGDVILSNDHFNYLIDRVDDLNSSIFYEEGLPIVYVSYEKNLDGNNLGKIVLNGNKKLRLSEVVLDILDNPERVTIIGALDKLEIINSNDLERYDKINTLTEKDLEQIAEEYNF